MKLWGPNGAVIFMCLWAGGLCLLTWFWVRRHVQSWLWSVLAIFALVTSISFLGLVGHVFPDLVIAALLVGAALLLTSPPTWWRYLLLGLIIGALPWIHVKMLTYAGMITILSLWPVRHQWRQRAAWRQVVWLLAPAAILLVLYEWSLVAWYHTLIPSVAFSSSGQLFQISPLVYYGGGLFDRIKGLLINNPAYGFIFIGLPLWFRYKRRSFTIVALMILPALILQSTFGDWWGGWSPTGRYWLEFLPLLLPGLAYAVASVTSWLWRGFFVIVLAAQLKFAQIYLAAKTAWPLPADNNVVLTKLASHGIGLVRFLPSFWGRVTLRSWAETLAMIVALVALAVLGWLLAPRTLRPASRK